MKIKSNQSCNNILEIQNAPSQTAYSLLITDSAGNYLLAIETMNKVRLLTFENGTEKEIKSEEDLTRAFVASILAMCCSKPEYKDNLSKLDKKKLIKLFQETIENLS